MTEKVGNPKLRVAVLLLWILLGYFYFSLAYEYITIADKDKKLEDYIQYIVVEAGDQHRQAKEVRALVLVRADELQLPVHDDQVSVSGSGMSLKIAVIYFVDINMPVFQRSIYTKVFQHNAAYRNIR
jgi:hypothetical protein